MPSSQSKPDWKLIFPATLSLSNSPWKEWKNEKKSSAPCEKPALNYNLVPIGELARDPRQKVCVSLDAAARGSSVRDARAGFIHILVRRPSNADFFSAREEAGSESNADVACDPFFTDEKSRSICRKKRGVEKKFESPRCYVEVFRKNVQRHSLSCFLAPPRRFRF